MKRQAYEVTLAETADRDFLDIMDWSSAQFGAAATNRYEALIGQALIDMGEDPFRPGAQQRPELPKGLYTYHLTGSRENVAGERVKAPRHFLLYRVTGSAVDVLRILHDSRDLAQHVPEPLPRY